MSEKEYSHIESKLTSEKQSLSELQKASLRIAVLISGSGSNLQALIDAIESGQLPGVEIALVVSNKSDTYGLERARKHKLPVRHLPWDQRAEAERQLIAILRSFGVDLIVLAGWMRILTPWFVNQFPQRIINLHPALLPDDGMSKTYVTSDGTKIPAFRGLHVVKQALDAGVKVTGSTVHYVTPEVDAGPVICREEVAIEEGDTEETLHERIKRVEHRLIVEAVRRYAQGL
jgi:phosphoribosylglycinamide formyltransferase-1